MSNEHTTWTTYASPIGPLMLIAGERGITNLHFPGRSPGVLQAARRPMPDATAQLDAYFAGELRSFELDLNASGTPLQEQIWKQLLKIPFGATTTYGAIAGRIDESLYDPALETYMRARVVGAAIGSNPLPILVACHRVIGADGSLTGYRGGLPRKRALLDLERRATGDQPAEPS